MEVPTSARSNTPRSGWLASLSASVRCRSIPTSLVGRVPAPTRSTHSVCRGKSMNFCVATVVKLNQMPGVQNGNHWKAIAGMHTIRVPCLLFSETLSTTGILVRFRRSVSDRRTAYFTGTVSTDSTSQTISTAGIVDYKF